MLPFRFYRVGGPFDPPALKLSEMLAAYEFAEDDLDACLYLWYKFGCPESRRAQIEVKVQALLVIREALRQWEMQP